MSDFKLKSTKVVLTGDFYLDQALKSAFKNVWQINPFEFCSVDEFEKLKSNPNYYFAVVLNYKLWGNTQKALMLDIVKGGSGDSPTDMLELVKFPLCTRDSLYQKAAIFMPSIISYVQYYINSSLKNGFGDFKTFSLKEVKNLPIYISQEDAANQAKSMPSTILKRHNISIVKSSMADEIYKNGVNALVSYVVYPSMKIGSSGECYKMLFDAYNHKLYYYKTSWVNWESDGGFLEKELKYIISTR